MSLNLLLQVFKTINIIKGQSYKLESSLKQPREMHVKKPDWLKIKLGATERFAQTNNIVQSHSLHTICSSGKCLNMEKCWDRGTATFMIAGDICTRSCKFCNTKSGKPMPMNVNEPKSVANSIQLMSLKHAVITSVDRDDLAELGAAHWVKTIEVIREKNPKTTI